MCMFLNMCMSTSITLHRLSFQWPVVINFHTCIVGRFVIHYIMIHIIIVSHAGTVIDCILFVPGA